MHKFPREFASSVTRLDERIHISLICTSTQTFKKVYRIKMLWVFPGKVLNIRIVDTYINAIKFTQMCNCSHSNKIHIKAISVKYIHLNIVLFDMGSHKKGNFLVARPLEKKKKMWILMEHILFQIPNIWPKTCVKYTTSSRIVKLIFVHCYK